MDRIDRDQKRAEALRANLQRRKAQARGRAHPQSAPSDPESRTSADHGAEPNVRRDDADLRAADDK